MQRKKTLSPAAAAALTAMLATPVMAAPMLTPLVSFNNQNNPINTGQNPHDAVILDSGGNIYGTTASGGSQGAGNVFEVTGLNAITSLAIFGGVNGASPGSNPYGGLVADGGGNLYGTTEAGGSSTDGTVFEVANDPSHTVTTLVNFTGSNGVAPGANPYAGMIFDHSGNLFGTTESGGANGNGNVYEIANDPSHTVTTLADFTGNTGTTPGKNPYGPLVADSSGNLFGTTYNGGTNGDGTVFEIANDGSHTFIPIFTFNSANGQNPQCNLILDSSGNIYGTTTYGGADGQGTVFEISATPGHALTPLATFGGYNSYNPAYVDGAEPYGGLLMDAAGNLFGTATNGGSNYDGTVFEIAAGTHAFSTVATFAGSSNGANPYGGLVADSAGNLYGATFNGGQYYAGTVFEITGSGFVVPEPASLSLLAIGALGMLQRRRIT